MALYLLFESASGYSLFHVYGLDETRQDTEAVRNSILDLERFGKLVKLAAFHPFSSALDALNQTNAVSKGFITDELRSFLEINLPRAKEGENPMFSLGVAELKLGSHISEATEIPCQSTELVLDLLRGVRLHFDRLIKDLIPADSKQAQRGLDNMVIQAIFLLDTVVKDINSFSARLIRWYSWHFPELRKIVYDKCLYAEVANFVENKLELSEDHIPGLTNILGDEEKAKEIVEAAKSSQGLDLSTINLINVKQFAQKVMELSAQRKNLHKHLATKMNDIAPNLTSLVGEELGARLISRAGSISDLAKSTSSRLVFKLLSEMKTLRNTKKYGLISRSYFYNGRAYVQKKGLIALARYIASKCSLASRIDCFSEASTTVFGEKLRKQVEERLDLYDTVAAAREKVGVAKAAKESARDGQKSQMGRGGEPAEASVKKKKKKCDGKSVDGGPMAADTTDAADGDAFAVPAAEKKSKKCKRHIAAVVFR